jgi:hypothetical protein
MSIISILAQLLDQGTEAGSGQAKALVPPSNLEIDIDRLSRRLRL